MEQSPALVFGERELRQQSNEAFDELRMQRLIRKAAVPSSPREFVHDGRRVVVMERDGAPPRGIDVESPGESVELDVADLARWEVNMPRLAERFRNENGLRSSYAEIGPRIHFLGELSTGGSGVVLGFIDSPRRANVLLPALTNRLPARFSDVQVLTVTFQPEPALAKLLESCGVWCETLDANAPFRIPGALRESRYRFVRSGAAWTVSFDGMGCTVPDSKGMRYIATLLRKPDELISALELDGRATSELTYDVERVSDTQTKASLERRALELQAALEDAAGDAAKRVRIREELEALLDQKRRDVGLRGKPRRFNDESERARKSVQKAIDRALTNIRQHSVEAASFLSRSIDTGHLCVYRQTSGVSWET